MNRHERRRAVVLERRRTGYSHRILTAFANGSLRPKPGTVNFITIEHNSWCGIYKGRGCDCVPNIIAPEGDEVVVVDENGDGQKVQRQ
jgi:hypothetical protein